LKGFGGIAQKTFPRHFSICFCSFWMPSIAVASEKAAVKAPAEVSAEDVSSAVIWSMMIESKRRPTAMPIVALMASCSPAVVRLTSVRKA